MTHHILLILNPAQICPGSLGSLDPLALQTPAFRRRVPRPRTIFDLRAVHARNARNALRAVEDMGMGQKPGELW